MQEFYDKWRQEAYDVVDKAQTASARGIKYLTQYVLVHLKAAIKLKYRGVRACYDYLCYTKDILECIRLEEGRLTAPLKGEYRACLKLISDLEKHTDGYE
jgi:hypothetical protein